MKMHGLARLFVAIALVTSGCSSTAGTPGAEEAATDVQAATPQRSSSPSDTGDVTQDEGAELAPEVNADRPEQESLVVSGRPESPPEGFPFDCTPQSAQLVTVVSFGEEGSIGLGDDGEVLWESSEVKSVATRDWVNPQTNEYYVDEERLISRVDGDVLEEFEGSFRTRPGADCSIPYEGIDDTPNHLVAPNGHILWQAPAGTGALESLTPSAVLYYRSGARDHTIGVSVEDGTELWNAPYDDLTVPDGSDVAWRFVGDDREFIDTRTGEVLWTLASKDTTTFLNFCGDVVWASWNDGGIPLNVEVRKAATGEILRTYDRVQLESYAKGDEVARAATGMLITDGSTLTIEHDCENPTGDVVVDLAPVSFLATVNDSTLAIATGNGTVYFIEPTTGEILHAREDHLFGNQVYATGSTFLIRDGEDTLFVVDARTGDVIAEHRNIKTVGNVLAPPHVDEPIIEVFLVEGQGGLALLNSVTGEFIAE